jgi:toxin-antitoxin system PIN domain toxin
MRSLLDVNVLIALLDADHALHDVAIKWYSRHAEAGWASCPSTQNGCMRIMSNANYPHPVPVSAIHKRLVEASGTPLHEFWPDDVSFLEDRIVDPTRIHGPRQLTDLYLLALAVRHHGRFVTFDGSIAFDAVEGAGKHHILTL